MIRRIAAGFILAVVLGGCATSSASPPATEPRTPTNAPSNTPVPPRSSVPSSNPPAALPQGSDVIELDPADFAGIPIDHPFWPMSPGSTWTYRETDADGAEQQVVVTVLPETREILGITATVVHDLVSADGETVEDTIDWYAQDASGNLWYLGEDTKEYENGEVVSTEGSWEAGVDGAQAGIILPADPQPGVTYRQEYYAGQAEDAAEILSLDAHAEVPFGTFDGCLETRDLTPLDPDVVEEKRYARGVGPVEVVQVSGGTSHEVLLTYEPGAYAGTGTYVTVAGTPDGHPPGMATAGGTVHRADRQLARVPVVPPARASRPRAEPVVDWDEAAVEILRAREYARLDAAGQVYLDYTGGGLYADSQVQEHLAMLRSGVLGNPHSASPASRTSTELADGARRAILAFLNADPDEYTVVFTPNASGALRLVGEAYPFAPGRGLLLTADNHNSVNGIREFARARGADVTYVPLTSELRVDPDALADALHDPPAGGGLFAYPAQSNYSGVRHPLDWIGRAQARGWDVLLDAAAFVPTSRLDLSRVRPDFVAVSWYKAIGYPTGIGSLVARRDALARLRRPWFGGGTISLASVATQRHRLSIDEAGFEDGTIDYLGLPAIEIGLRHLEAITLETVHCRVAWLTERLLDRLGVLRHSTGTPLVRIYGPVDTIDRGGTIAFNLLDPAGGLVGLREVERRAAERRISLRTGCFCNPGASEAARGITAGEMDRVFALGHAPTDDELAAIMPGKALGAVRVSVGIATNERDLDRFIDLVSEFAA